MKSNTRFTADECFVAQILLDMMSMPPQSPSDFKWIRKKRRSRCYQSKPKPPDNRAASASPVTPLAFSSNQSGSSRTNYTTPHSNTLLQKKYIDVIEELSEQRDLLREEIRNVTCYHNNLIAYNSQLKTMRKEVSKMVEISFGIQPQPLVLDQMVVGPSDGPVGIPDLNLPLVSSEFRDGRSRFAEARKRRMGIIKSKKIKFARTR